MYQPPQQASSPHISRGYTAQQNSQPVNMLNLLVRHPLTAQEHDFHLQLHEGMRVVKAPITQSFYSFRAPRQFEHVKTSGSKLTMQLHFYQKFSKVSSCPARSIETGIQEQAPITL